MQVSRPTIVVALVVLGAAISSAQADFLFDVQYGTDNTETGWTLFEVDYYGESSATATDQSVTATLTSSDGDLRGRSDRGTPLPATLEDVWMDLAFVSAQDARLNITLSGLAAGSYDITLYAYDPGGSLGGFTADVFLNDVDVADIEMTNKNTDPLTYGQQTITAVSDGLSDVVIGLQAQPDGISEGRAILNGIQIVPIPEPGSLALLGFSALAIIKRRHRR